MSTSLNFDKWHIHHAIEMYSTYWFLGHKQIVAAYTRVYKQNDTSVVLMI